jgi:hypothetical protein
MGRRSFRDDLRAEIERQIATAGKVDLTAAARAVGCNRPTASILWNHGRRATATTAAVRPLKEELAAPGAGVQLDADGQLLRDVRGVVSRTTSAAAALLDGIGAALPRARATLAAGSEITLVLDVTDRLARISAQLVSAVDKLTAAGKTLAAKRPPVRPTAPPPAPESDADVDARLAQRAAELGDDAGEAVGEGGAA